MQVACRCRANINALVYQASIKRLGQDSAGFMNVSE
jgi:hypothetical protein